MRKKIIWCVALALVLFIAACSGSNEQAEGNVDENNAAPQEQSQEQGNESKSDYPNGTIELIVPYSAGGTTDIIARLLAEHASNYLPNQPQVVVVNKSGGNGVVGATALKNAEPDGYTIGFTELATLTIVPHVDPSVDIAYDSLQPVLQAVSVPQLVVTNSDAPWQTIDEWLEAMKNSDIPFLIGTTGFGGLQHLVVEQLKKVTGAQMEMVPLNGSSEVVTAILAGDVQAGILGVPNVMGNDKLLPLASSGSKTDVLPDLPTLKEKGLEVAGDLYFGLFAPKGIDKEKLSILYDAFAKVLNESEVTQQLQEMGYQIVPGDPSQFEQTISELNAHFSTVVEQAGIAQQ